MRGMIKQMKNLKQTKGITLIALIITIIVLLILAGVTIGMLTGDNGILKNAQSSADKQNIAQGRERIELLLSENAIDRIIGDKEKTIGEIIGALEGKEGIASVNQKDEKTVTVLTDEGYMYEVTIDDEGKIKIEDIGKKTEPIISNIIVTNKNTHSISIEIKTQNVEEETYIYWYKKEGQEYQKAHESKEKTYTYEGLEANVIYNIKVEIKEKNAKKEINVLTGEMPKGTITFTEAEWEEGVASVEVSTTTEYEVYIQKGTVEDNKTAEEIESGTWEKAPEDGKITGLVHKDKIYAKLFDGINYGTEWATTEIIDEENPTIATEQIEAIGTKVKITVTGADSKSGIKAYEYYLGDTLITSIGTNSYTYRGLEELTEYKIKVKVIDNAENSEQIEETITTQEATIADILKAGNYVNYVDKSGKTRTCIVLYDDEYNDTNNTDYGIQIVAQNTLDQITFGGTTLDAFRTSYNSLINTLNTKAEAYLNTTYATGARSVGTVPDNPSYESEYLTSSHTHMYIAGINGTFRNADSNYSTDYSQLTKLSICTSDYDYWLGSRFLEMFSDAVSFGFYSVQYSNYVGGYNLWRSYLGGTSDNGRSWGSKTETHRLRPVFTLRTDLKITGGAGTSGSPYTLGI